MSAEIEIARQWVAKAMSDLLNADNNLVATRVPFDTICFHCQQAAEKLLKAFLAARECLHPGHMTSCFFWKIFSRTPRPQKFYVMIFRS